MHAFYRAPLVGALLCLLFCAGCMHIDGYAWRNTDWARSPHIARVRVVVLDSADESRDPAATPAAPTKANVEKWTREALQKVPGTLVVSTAPNASQPPDARSADTLCRVTIGNAGAAWGIALPDLWFARSSISYDIELINIPTDELRFKAVRTVTSGGAFNLLPLTDIPTLYQRDLAHVLAFATAPHIPAAPSATAAATAAATP